MNNKNLHEKHCVPCEGGVLPLDEATANEYLAELSGWQLSSNTKKISKTFKFKDFAEALSFTNKVGKVAESENHHPDIELSWGRVVVALWTHAIDGLSENDFILAAKIDLL